MKRPDLTPKRLNHYTYASQSAGPSDEFVHWRDTHYTGAELKPFTGRPGAMGYVPWAEGLAHVLHRLAEAHLDPLPQPAVWVVVDWGCRQRCEWVWWSIREVRACWHNCVLRLNIQCRNRRRDIVKGAG